MKSTLFIHIVRFIRHVISRAHSIFQFGIMGLVVAFIYCVFVFRSHSFFCCCYYCCCRRCGCRCRLVVFEVELKLKLKLKPKPDFDPKIRARCFIHLTEGGGYSATAWIQVFVDSSIVYPAIQFNTLQRPFHTLHKPPTLLAWSQNYEWIIYWDLIKKIRANNDTVS